MTYANVGGCKEQIEKLRAVVEVPLSHPKRFVNLGIDPPKCVLLFGPPDLERQTRYVARWRTLHRATKSHLLLTIYC